ncbi:hypothetical protein BU15DRAFT_76727 [Melanogaster broomeanus]|nr:hypothetical protein BU15DRAFT_76727 [Melanogaster broomeanus]
MPRGRPRKRLRNISGLHGQLEAGHATPLAIAGDNSRPVDDSDQYESESDHNGQFKDNLAVAFDGLKINFEEAYGDTDGSDMSDIDEEIELGILEDEEFGRKLAEMVEKEDGKDPEWIPERMRRKKQRCHARPKTYQKGPDVMSKSERTQRRHKAQWRTQTALDVFGFMSKTTAMTSALVVVSNDSNTHCSREPQPHPDSEPVCVLPTVRRASMLSISSTETPERLLEDEDNEPIVARRNVDESGMRSDSDAVLVDESGTKSDAGESEAVGGDEALTGGEGETEDWEDELDDTIRGPTAEIKDWKLLREQIKANLKNKHKTLPLSQINQLMILSNFATLRLKGTSRITASTEIARQWEDSRR